MEPHSTSKPVTVPIVAACRAVSTTVSVLRASCERRRRPAKGRRSASASRRPGPASVSRSSTSRGGKGACLNGVAAAAAAMETEHAKHAIIESDKTCAGENGADPLGNAFRTDLAHRGAWVLSSPPPPAAAAAPRLACLHGAAPLPLSTTVPAAAAAVHACCPTLRGGGAVSVCAAR